MANLNENKNYLVVEDNKIVNIIVGVEPETIKANPGKYIEYDRNNLDLPTDLDLNGFFDRHKVFYPLLVDENADPNNL